MRSEGAAGQRTYALMLALLLVGGALALLAAGRTWATATVTGGLRDEVVAVTGADLSPGVRALGLLALAGVLAVPATRSTGRRLVGLALAVAAGVGAVTAGWRAATLDERVTEELLAERGADVQQVSGTAWPWVAVVATLLVLVAGLLTAVLGSGWPALGGRFERRDGSAPARTSAPAGATGASASPRPGAGRGVEADAEHGGGADAGRATGAEAGRPAGRGDGPGAGPGSHPEAGPGAAAEPRADAGPDRARRSWDALDRGEDPTA